MVEQSFVIDDVVMLVYFFCSFFGHFLVYKEIESKLGFAKDTVMWDKKFQRRVGLHNF